MILRTVLRNEWRLLRADRALGLVLGVFALLFAYALANGMAWVDFQEETLAAAREGNHERVQALEAELQRIADGARPSSPFRDPRSPSVLGGASGAHTAVLDPGPLTALAVGQSDLLPYYYDVSIQTNESSFLQNGEIENPLNLLVGRFDLAFVVVYLLPLLILALSFNVLSGEREQGTLALTLSQPVSVRGVVTAKLAFRAILVMGLALGVSLLGVLFTGGFGSPGRVALWCAAVAAYALFWFTLAAWVNGLGRSSAWNATVLVGAWLLLVVVLPASVNITAGLLHPLPSRVEMITAQREASNEAVNQRSELLARYLEDHPELAGGVAAGRGEPRRAGVGRHRRGESPAGRGNQRLRRASRRPADPGAPLPVPVSRAPDAGSAAGCGRHRRRAFRALPIPGARVRGALADLLRAGDPRRRTDDCRGPARTAVVPLRGRADAGGQGPGGDSARGPWGTARPGRRGRRRAPEESDRAGIAGGVNARHGVT